MLRTETVKTDTFELLKTLMSDERLGQFYLVGGTALALYMWHRESVDIDLFSQKTFNVKELEIYLKSQYGFQTQRASDITLIGEMY